MPDKKISMWQSVDWFTVSLYVIMVMAGWFSIYGASYDFDNPNSFDPSGRPGMQLIWIGTSVVLIFLIMMLDKNFFETFAYPVYGFVILLLILTIFLAPDIKGSRSWLVITPSIRLQPAEFAKFATALALARFMNTYEFNLLTVKNFIISVGIILAPMLCIVLQKETGSVLVFLAFSLVLYREGMSGYVLLTSLCTAVFFVLELKYEAVMWHVTPVSKLIVTVLILLIISVMLRFVLNERKLGTYFTVITLIACTTGYAVSLFAPFNLVWIPMVLIICFSAFLMLYSYKKLVWRYALLALFAILSVFFLFSVDYVFNDVLKPYQQQRIKVSLGLEADPAGAGYNVNQSKIAIGSGGFSGKGYLNGTQTKLKYVPEQDTDFIFCTVGEEFGFVGSFLVLLVYGVFFIRLITLAERQSTVFGRVYGYGVMSIFLFHTFINIGMVCGLTPVIGIPLPFFSYGGSSLWGFTVLLFIFLRIDAAEKERK
ncbi:MAG: rod shape-determining protein RodA [Tannerella sp.]|jgi:rod shape determining protein RodA|nr:rod shape-determining protein RodA [Tannerella sp.]